MKKKIISMAARVLAFALVTAESASLALPVSVSAASEADAEIATFTFNPDEDTTFTSKYTDDELLEGYLFNEAKVESGMGFEPEEASSGSYLKGVNAALYEEVKPLLKEVAAGKRNYTVFAMKVSVKEALGSKWKSSYSAKDLGVSTIASGGKLTTEAQTAIGNLLGYSPASVIYSLLSDMPYDLYWFDKTSGLGYKGGVPIYGNASAIRFPETVDITLGFPVAAAYSTTGNVKTFYMNTAKAQAAATAAANAAAIVTANAGRSDYEKLVAYKNKIVELTDYDYDSYNQAMAGKTVNYGDPWQLIYAFDGNASTNIVCEGYSKAFKYLCDLSNFSSKKIECNIAYGKMANSSAGHMWNTVRMNDGKVYLVDITACDTAKRDFFLMGATKLSITDYKVPKYGVTYCFDESLIGQFTNREYGIATADYAYGAANDQSPIAMTVTLYARGGDITNSSAVVYYGGTYGNLPAPTRSGYTFQGWFFDKAYTMPVYAGTVVTKTENHILYAKWAAAPQPVNNTSKKNVSTKKSKTKKSKSKNKKLSSGAVIDTSKQKVTASAPYGKKVSKGKFKVLKNSGLEFVSPSSKKAKNVIIPSKIKIYGKTYKVTKLGGSAFKSCSKTKTVVVPSTVKTFSKGAFKGLKKKSTIIVCAKNKSAYKKTVKNIKKTSPNTKKCKFKFKKTK